MTRKDVSVEPVTFKIHLLNSLSIHIFHKNHHYRLIFFPHDRRVKNYRIDPVLKGKR